MSLAEHGEVINSLFEAFRALAEEGAKKDKRIERLERESMQLKQFVFQNVIDGLNQVKSRVSKFDKIDDLSGQVDLVKNGIADLKYVAANGPLIGQQQQHEKPIGSQMNAILVAIERIAQQRNDDVEAINNNLDRLESRLTSLAEKSVGGSQPGGNWHQISKDLESVRLDTIPDLESDWAAKWANLSGRVGALDDSIAKVRAELIASVDKNAQREGKIVQLGVASDNSKRLCEKLELGQIETTNTVRKLETDMVVLFEEIKRIENEHSSVFSLEAKVELGRAECKSNFERVQRVAKQDLENVRVKVERLLILKDELERMKHVFGGNASSLSSLPTSSLHASTLPTSSLHASSLPPLLTEKVLLEKSNSPLSESSLLSLVDEGITVAPGVRVSDNIYIAVPTGGSEAGTLRSDGQSRLSWRIDNMAAVVREPSRWPNILVSPQFEQGTLIGRLKLFPSGSDQSRIEGHCSLYLRCLPGVIVRFAIEMGGEVIETFECEYEKQRDKGKHDFVKLNEYIGSDGSLTIGLEIRSIRPI